MLPHNSTQLNLPQRRPQFGSAEAAIDADTVSSEEQKDAAFVATVRQALARSSGPADANSDGTGGAEGSSRQAATQQAAWRDPMCPTVPAKLARAAAQGGTTAAQVSPAFLPSQVRVA